MANYSYNTATHVRAFQPVCTALMVPALIVPALLGLATPDPIISSRVAHAQGVAQ